MKITKEELTSIIRQELSEGTDLKVGDEVLFHGKNKGIVKQIHTRGKLKGMIDVQKKGRTSEVTIDASSVTKARNSSVNEAKQPDLSKYKTKTLTDLYAVLYGKANTAKEKAGVEKIRAELVKRKVIKKEDVNEEMYDCIRDYQGMGYSYSEAVKKCKGSVWDEKGGKRGKHSKREGKEDTTMKITKERLKEIVREELQALSEGPDIRNRKYKTLSGKEVIARIKASKDKNMKYWYPQNRRKEIEKMKKVTVKDLEDMLPDSYPGSAIYGLWKDNEWKD